MPADKKTSLWDQAVDYIRGKAKRKKKKGERKVDPKPSNIHMRKQMPKGGTY